MYETLITIYAIIVTALLIFSKKKDLIQLNLNRYKKTKSWELNTFVGMFRRDLVK